MLRILSLIFYMINMTSALEIPLYYYNLLQLAFSVNVTVQEPETPEAHRASSSPLSSNDNWSKNEAAAVDCDE